MTPTAQAALQALSTKQWRAVGDVVAKIGRSESVVRRAIDQLLDAGFVRRKECKNSTGARMFMYQRYSHRKADLLGPLYEASSLNARPLARAFGNYTFTTGNNHGVSQ